MHLEQARTRPLLSVIVACANCAESVADSLDSIGVGCQGVSAELLVVDASIDGTAARVRSTHPHVRLLQLPPGTLVPQLWAMGMKEAQGDVVAVTIGHCVVNPGWARALLAEIEAGAAGAGGAFALPETASRTDRALFLLRYSAFLTGRPRGPVKDVAADNAAYRRDALQHYQHAWQGGFWEVEFHRLLSPADGDLRFTPEAVAEFRPSARLRDYLRQRFEHGRHFGSWRVRSDGQSALRVVAAAPVVPLVLLRRIAGRSWRGGGRRALLTSLPHLLLLAGAWAAGEAVGALAAPAAASPPAAEA